MFQRVAILGVGLMGGSLGLALRTRGLAANVVGMDKSAEILATAQKAGAIDAGVIEAAEAVREADAIFLAAPVGILPELLETIAPHVRPDALITDLGSVKTRIVAVGERLFGNLFIGGHPMAGSEESGVGAARAELFAGAAWAIVRSQPFVLESDASAVRLAELVRSLGARPVVLDSAMHDRLVALVSHLPHMLSFAFAQTVAADPDSEAARSLAGGSYRDLMRVSAADPFLWRDIFSDNRDALLAALAACETRLHAIKSALETNDPTCLLEALQKAKV